MVRIIQRAADECDSALTFDKPKQKAASSCLYSSLLHFIFFFQAEDGIRDSSVTGVQTCALPILLDQLTLLDSKMEEVADAVNKNDTEALLANGRFLEDRFGGSSLKLPSAS